MTSLSRLLSQLTTRYPIIPNMLSFSIIFPGANLVQQILFKNNSKNNTIANYKDSSQFNNNMDNNIINNKNSQVNNMDNNKVNNKHHNNKGRNHSINWNEVGRYSVYGGIIHGPVIHHWILFSTRMFPLNTFSHILVKVVMDQLIFAPFILSTFFISHSVMEGRTGEEMVDQWKAKFLPTWATGSSVWPFLIAFCHRFVPLSLRGTYIAICSFFWFIFLAHLKNMSEPWRPPLLRLIQ